MVSTDFTPAISIIIPTLNEESNISACITHLKVDSSLVKEIIVVDGGSKDKTVEIAKEKGATVLNCTKALRAEQMNMGAQHALGNVLYFVHADTRPPQSFAEDIAHAVKSGYKIGGYRQKFDKNQLKYKYNAFFSRFNFLFCRGGDQSFFIEKNFFDTLGGYNVKYVIMEEYDLMRRARKKEKFMLIPKTTLVSSRKYANNSFFRVNWTNAKAMIMFYCGINPQKIKSMYSKSLRPY